MLMAENGRLSISPEDELPPSSYSQIELKAGTISFYIVDDNNANAERQGTADRSIRNNSSSELTQR